MTDLKDYLHYFQTLANAHVEIKDFFVMDINEPLVAMRSDIKYPALVLNSLSGNFRSPNFDSMLDEINGGFLILGHLENLSDFSAEMLLLQQMKQIGTEVIARMLADLIACEPRAKKAIAGFNIDSVKYQMMDGIFENGYGFLFSFKIFSPVSLDHNPAKWNSSKVIPGKFTY